MGAALVVRATGTTSVTINVSQVGLLIAHFSNASGNNVTSVSGGGLTWTQKGGQSGALSPSNNVSSVWTAYASSALGSITVTPNTTTTDAACDLISGLNSTTPVAAVGGSWVATATNKYSPTVTPAATTDYLYVTVAGASNIDTKTAGTGMSLTGSGVNTTTVAELATGAVGSTSLQTPFMNVSDTYPYGQALALSLNTAAAAPTAPSAPTVGSITTTTASVNPGALTTGATSCNIQATTAADTTFATPVVTITGATPSSGNSVTGLTPGTDYIYRTQMVGAGGTTNGPATGSNPTLFAAPTGLVVAAVANTTQLSLTWTAASGNAPSPTYNVLRSTSSGSGYVQVATGIAVTNWTDNTGLAGSTNYYYVVQQVDTSGASANSTQGTGIILTNPAAPTGLLGTPSTGGGTPQVVLNWTGATGAVTYKLYRSATLGGTYTLVVGAGAISGTTFTDQTVSSGNPYFYKISGVNATGEGPQSSASAQEFVGVPSPTGLTANVVAGQGVDLSWTAPASYTGTGYNVYRINNTSYNGVPHRNYNEQPFLQVPWGTTTYRDRKLGLPKISGDNIYTYYVTTVNGANESVLSTASTPVTWNG